MARRSFVLLLDRETQLATLRDFGAAGKIRYVGITHYATSSFERMEKLVRTEQLDFIQLPYSAATREAEKRLLPAAAESGPRCSSCPSRRGPLPCRP